jgi:hypothetical protein
LTGIFEDVKRLPRYPTVPAVRIGRLAVDQRFQRRGLGEAMLADATERALKADVAAFMLVVDAKNDQAVAFYGDTISAQSAANPGRCFCHWQRPKRSFSKRTLTDPRSSLRPCVVIHRKAVRQLVPE